jgi:gamma-glutamylcyclotransferase (GGCT)/AIG2-like uncharacterized protein YtfP
MERLFSYGTLRDEKVQRAVFGRRLEGTPDAILGYRLGSVTISDPSAVSISGMAVHRIVDATGRDSDQVEGIVLELTAKELELADTYEDVAYKRAKVRLRSGNEAWLYVRA